MKKRFFSVALLLSFLLLAAAAFLYFSDRNRSTEDKTADALVALNEIQQLAKSGDFSQITQKATALQDHLHSLQPASMDPRFLILCAISILCFCALLGYLYFYLLRPFQKLEEFAGEIAKGNFDFPLNYERSNYFGAFTWAFDSMRREITRARAGEREAAENHKTVIATLSHDIKTPVASIRAYAEGLEANLATSPEKRAKYLGIIMKKCDEVSRLTNDLFLHSLTDLDKLKISTETIDLCALLNNEIAEIAGGQDDLSIAVPPQPVYVLADKNRLVQVAENLINNARKYAKTKIDISLQVCGQEAVLSFLDHGDGIPDEDMPFIFEQFYRGKNRGNESGAGLGLYIVKDIVERMGGQVLAQNYVDGLAVKVVLGVVSGFKTGSL